MRTTKKALQDLSLGQPTTVRNLTVFPLLFHEARVPQYLLLEDAMAKGFLAITEVSRSGSVRNLLVHNRGELPVLLLEGQHLVGCNQNRVLNVSVLARAAEKTVIPVSCVEQGRWRSESSRFEVSNRVMYAELRATKCAQVSANLRRHHRHYADQSAIWDAIAEKSRRMGSASRSGAMGGVYSRHERSVQYYVRGILNAEGQCGGVFAINGRVVGLELLDAQSNWSTCSKSVISGYALDALDHLTDSFEPVTPARVAAFLGRLTSSEESYFDSVGLGAEVRFHAFGLTGSALAYGEGVVHLCAFDLGPVVSGADPTARRYAADCLYKAA